MVDRVDRVSGSRDGPYLNGYACRTVTNEEIDLATVDNDVPVLGRDTSLGQPSGRERFSRRTQVETAIGQSLSSVFSSFSTLTSRKVST